MKCSASQTESRLPKTCRCSFIAFSSAIGVYALSQIASLFNCDSCLIPLDHSSKYSAIIIYIHITRVGFVLFVNKKQFRHNN